MHDLSKQIYSLKEAIKETMCPSELDAILEWTEFYVDDGTDVLIRVGRPGRVFSACVKVKSGGYSYRNQNGVKVKFTEPTQVRSAFSRERTVYDETV